MGQREVLTVHTFFRPVMIVLGIPRNSVRDLQSEFTLNQVQRA